MQGLSLKSMTSSGQIAMVKLNPREFHVGDLLDETLIANPPLIYQQISEKERPWLFRKLGELKFKVKKGPETLSSDEKVFYRAYFAENPKAWKRYPLRDQTLWNRAFETPLLYFAAPSHSRFADAIQYTLPRLHAFIDNDLSEAERREVIDNLKLDHQIAEEVVGQLESGDLTTIYRWLIPFSFGLRRILIETIRSPVLFPTTTEQVEAFSKEVILNYIFLKVNSEDQFKKMNEDVTIALDWRMNRIEQTITLDELRLFSRKYLPLFLKGYLNKPAIFHSRELEFQVGIKKHLEESFSSDKEIQKKLERLEVKVKVGVEESWVGV